jgi:hypothetical protein
MPCHLPTHIMPCPALMHFCRKDGGSRKCILAWTLLLAAAYLKEEKVMSIANMFICCSDENYEHVEARGDSCGSF